MQAAKSFSDARGCGNKTDKGYADGPGGKLRQAAGINTGFRKRLLGGHRRHVRRDRCALE